MVMHDPRVPETLEGWSLLHQMFRIRWEAWRALPDAERRQRASATVDGLAGLPRGEAGATARPPPRAGGGRRAPRPAPAPGAACRGGGGGPPPSRPSSATRAT